MALLSLETWSRSLSFSGCLRAVKQEIFSNCGEAFSRESQLRKRFDLATFRNYFAASCSPSWSV